MTYIYVVHYPSINKWLVSYYAWGYKKWYYQGYNSLIDALNDPLMKLKTIMVKGL